MNEDDFREDLQEFANICGLPNCAIEDFNNHIEYICI